MSIYKRGENFQKSRMSRDAAAYTLLRDPPPISEVFRDAAKWPEPIQDDDLWVGMLVGFVFGACFGAAVAILAVVLT